MQNKTSKPQNLKTARWAATRKQEEGQNTANLKMSDHFKNSGGK